MLFNKYLVKLLLEIYRNKQINRKSQKVYKSNIGYYLAIRFLKKNGLIKCNGVDNNNMKVWILTPKGFEVANHIIEIRKAIGIKNPEVIE